MSVLTSLLTLAVPSFFTLKALYIAHHERNQVPLVPFARYWFLHSLLTTLQGILPIPFSDAIFTIVKLWLLLPYFQGSKLVIARVCEHDLPSGPFLQVMEAKVNQILHVVYRIVSGLQNTFPMRNPLQPAHDKQYVQLILTHIVESESTSMDILNHRSQSVVRLFGSTPSAQVEVQNLKNRKSKKDNRRVVSEPSYPHKRVPSNSRTSKTP